MLKRTIIAGLATLALGIGLSVAAPVSPANAGNIELHISGSSGHGRHDARHHHRRHNALGPRRGHRHNGHRNRVCRPGKALHKAERRGLYRVRINRVNHRYVVVKGRKRGRKIKMAFYRDSRRCEIAWVKRGRRHSHGYRY